MIRWRFVLSRLLIMVAIVMVLRWGLGPVANFITIRGLESMTGARVEIGQTRVGLFPPSLGYRQVRIADPRSDKAMRDAVRAESINLVIDGDSLLHRRFVIREGSISGIHVGAARTTSGHLPPTSAPRENDEATGPGLLSRLFGGAANAVEQEAEALLAEMETHRVSNEIRQRWELEYRQLSVRARELEKQIRGVRDQARDVRNPLRDWPELEKTLADARSARNELLEVRAKIDALPAQLQRDFALLDEAKRRDLDRLQELVPVDLSQGSDVASDLLTASIRQQIARVQEYIENGRQIADYTVVAPKSERSRGETFDLYGAARRPSILIRSCEVGGVMRVDGEVYSIVGMLENLTPTPEILDQPARARLRLEGPENIRLEYVRDQRGGRDIDLLTLHWPEMDSKATRLGDADHLALAIDGGQRELWVQIRSENDRFRGRLVSKQSDVAMSLLLHPKFEQSAAAQSLRSSLAEVDRIEIDAQFDGSWNDLHVSLNTNLSRVFRKATEDAIVHQAQATKQKLANKITTIHQQQTDQLREWLGTQQSEALSLVASADQSIEEMSQKVLHQVGDADAYLGKLRGSLQDKLR